MTKYTIQQTTLFKRDLRRVQKQAKDLTKLASVLESLRQGAPLSWKCINHFLHGFPGYQELHLGFDWLLIYEQTGQNVRLLRTGSHAALF